MRSTPFFAAVVIAVLALPAFAQNQPEGTPAYVRGTVEKLDGQVLSVKERDGQTAAVKLTPDATVLTLVKKTVADIKPGDFVASTGIKGKDGKIHAIEARILPAADRRRRPAIPLGPGAGQRDDQRHGRHRHQGADGAVLHVTFKGGESEYSIGPDVPILAPAPGDMSLLKPGAAVFVIAPQACRRQRDVGPPLRREGRHQAADVDSAARHRSRAGSGELSRGTTIAAAFAAEARGLRRAVRARRCG